MRRHSCPRVKHSTSKIVINFVILLTYLFKPGVNASEISLGTITHQVRFSDTWGKIALLVNVSVVHSSEYCPILLAQFTNIMCTYNGNSTFLTGIIHIKSFVWHGIFYARWWWYLLTLLTHIMLINDTRLDLFRSYDSSGMPLQLYRKDLPAWVSWVLFGYS